MIDLTLDANFDLVFTETGDLGGYDYLNTAIITALFTDKRLGGKRGHFSLLHDEASKLWRYEQARIRTDTLVEVRAYVITALKFLLEDEFGIRLWGRCASIRPKYNITKCIGNPNKWKNKKI